VLSWAWIVLEGKLVDCEADLKWGSRYRLGRCTVEVDIDRFGGGGYLGPSETSESFATVPQSSQ
jgi:hypothetical protein